MIVAINYLSLSNCNILVSVTKTCTGSANYYIGHMSKVFVSVLLTCRYLSMVSGFSPEVTMGGRL